MTGHKEWFRTLTDIPRGRWSVRLADNRTVWAAGIGDISISAELKGEVIQHTLTNVLYIPGLKKHLFSIGKADERGFRFSCMNSECEIRNAEGVLLVSGLREGQLYRLAINAAKQSLANLAATWDETDDPPTSNAFITHSQDYMQALHEKFGHANNVAITKTLKQNSVTGISACENRLSEASTFCKGCVMGKHQSG
jgi:hypothetical protein